MSLPTISANTPSAGYISWTAFGIQYNGQSFNILAGNTNKKFVWWLYNGGTSPALVAGDILPALTPDDMVLFLNKAGVGVLAPAAQVVDGSLIVSGSILADAIGANVIETWHLDGQIITAANMTANSVTAASLAAGAVTTNKLSVAAMGDDMVANGSFEDGTQGWRAVAGNGTADVVTGVSSSGAYALRIVRGTVNEEVMQDTPYFIPVTSVAGRSWYVAARAGAGVSLASGFYLRVMWYQADKATAASTAYVDVAANKSLSTTWALFEGQVTPPANARYMAIKFINANGTSTMYVDESQAYEVIQSAAIADGAITAAKILANSITSNHIQSGTIVAANIAANTITAAQIAAGAIDTAELKATAINGMTITGATVQTASSGQRAVLAGVDIKFYSPNGSSGSITAIDNGAAGGVITINGGTGPLSIGNINLPVSGSVDASVAALRADRLYVTRISDITTGLDLLPGTSGLVVRSAAAAATGPANTLTDMSSNTFWTSAAPDGCLKGGMTYNNGFIAPIAGFYRVSLGVATNQNFVAGISVNNANVTIYQDLLAFCQGSANAWAASGSADVYVPAGGVIRYWVMGLGFQVSLYAYPSVRFAAERIS